MADARAETNMSGLPFDDIRAVMRNVPAFDQASADAASNRQSDMMFARAERGRLADIAVWAAGWRGQQMPQVGRVELCMFASASGWPEQAVQHRALDQARTRVLLLSAGGSAANIIAANMGAGLKVFDLALERPTPSALAGAAMSEAECVRAMAFGMEAVAGQSDLLCLTGFGVGSREVAAGLAMILFGGQPADWLAGGLTQLTSSHRAAVDYLTGLGALLDELPPQTDALAALARFGGRELAATAGAILAARTQQVPVVLEGFEATLAAAVLARAQPGMADHCLLAASDGTAAHHRLISQLAFEPLLDLGILGGHGTSSLLAAQLVQTSCQLHREMASRAQMDALLADTGGNA